MPFENFRVDTDESGIALVTWDMPGRSLNVFTMGVMDELDRIIDQIAGESSLKGAVIVSGKPGFSGGADITLLAGIAASFEAVRGGDPQAAQRTLLEQSGKLSRVFRKLETCGKPFVTAIHGVCMGGATELALASHGRVLSDDRFTTLALPEVKIGIFPGGGGTQRIMRSTRRKPWP